MGTASRDAVSDSRWMITLGVMILVVFSSVWMGFVSSTTVLLKHTWEQPTDAPGNLYSQRGGRDHMFLIGLSIVPWVVCILLLWMLAYPASNVVRDLHFMVSVLLWIFLLVVFVIWSIDYSKANTQSLSNADNLFNDDRWCLVNFGVAPAFCANKVVPTMATSQYLINQASLGVNGITVTTYWMLFAFWIFVALQMIYVRQRWTPLIKAYFVSSNDPMEEEEEKDERTFEIPEPRVVKPFTPPASAPAASALQMPLRMKKNHHRIK